MNEKDQAPRKRPEYRDDAQDTVVVNKMVKHKMAINKIAEQTPDKQPTQARMVAGEDIEVRVGKSLCKNKSLAGYLATKDSLSSKKDPR